ncbi:MAG: hypothetical protein LQ346_000546 [Caloplaca aetnensis]|nr:MAG: hypothetical protein LQ346_000546 [Caloplaca aetnensis]
MDSTSSATSSVDTPPVQQEPSWDTASHKVNGDNADVISSPRIAVLDPQRSPSAVSARAFVLGLTFGASVVSTLFLSRRPSNPLWRASCFLASLSAFHFLEFYVTALYNPPAATINAFLLTSNGYAYNIAHTLALAECIFRHYVTPLYFSQKIYLYPLDAVLPAGETAKTVWLILGFAMLVVGQGTRTLAMMHAGTNFNHLVQSQKKAGHILVTDGIYSWLRHPSYFGFFWWGLATQLIMGNTICLTGYAFVLWSFFSHRIAKEETLLVGFFGSDYVRYRDKTMVGIPLIP